jgi:threonine aldolase
VRGIVAEVREWRRRMGGTLYGMWPGAASALTCLRERLPKLPAWMDHTRAIAQALRDVPGITVVPDPPQTPMLHLLLRATEERFEATVRRLAEEDGIWTWKRAVPTDDPAVRRVELAVAEATAAFPPEQVRELLARFVARR